MIKGVVVSPDRIGKIEANGEEIVKIRDLVVKFLEEKGLCEKEEEIKIELNKGYLLVENIGSLMVDDFEFKKVVDEIAKSSNTLDFRTTIDDDSLFIVLKSITDSCLAINNLDIAIRTDAIKFKELDSALAIEDVKLTTFGRIETREPYYKQYNYEIYKTKENGIIAETKFTVIEDCDKRSEVIKEICTNNNFKYCLEEDHKEEQNEMGIHSKEVVIEPNSTYLILNRCKEVASDISRILEKTATDKHVIEMGISNDNDTIIISFDKLHSANQYMDEILGKIKRALENIEHLGEAITASEVGIFVINTYPNAITYNNWYCTLSNVNGKVNCTITRRVSSTPLSDIRKLANRLGFRCTIEDVPVKVNTDVEKELDNEQFPHLVESYKPDYLDKQEKLAIIQEMNVIHTSFYGVFKDTLLRMSGLALHSLKNELNNNNLKGALEILIKHIKD